MHVYFSKVCYSIAFIILISDPANVIGLYPDLLPPDYRKQLKYPETLAELEGAELERGLLSLIEYLIQVGELFI